MSVTRATVRVAARQMIQDPASGLGSGVQFLLADPGDYNVGIAQALRIFEGDVPNRRVAHYTVPSTAFRFPLAGTGAILPPSPPPLPMVTPVGADTGATTYSYRVAARNGAGQGLWSQAAVILARPATLSSTGKNLVAWSAAPGATSYDVFGRTGGSEQLLANVTGGALTYLDDGTATPAGLLSTTGLDAWIIDASEVDLVWVPYFQGVSSSAIQGQDPIDDNEWRLMKEPGPLVFLELADRSAGSGMVLRLEYTSPHVVDENSAAYTSVTSKWVEALETCVAAHLLRMVANRYLQNAGTTGLPSDVVDRRSQSDQAASRAKEFMGIYKDLIGGGEARGGASGFADMDVTSSHNRGMLWHPSRIR